MPSINDHKFITKRKTINNGTKVCNDVTTFNWSPIKFKNVSYAKSIKRSIEGSDLVIIHTEWNDFKSLNFRNLVKGKKFIIYDMRNIYSAKKIRDQGFKYFSVGR